MVILLVEVVPEGARRAIKRFASRGRPPLIH
jgi:hypothetical protein